MESSEDFSALMLASAESHTDTMEALLATKTDVNIQKQNGATALIIASAARQIKNVKALLKAGASINA